MDNRTSRRTARLLRRLGLIPLIAFGLLSTLATGGGGGGDGGGGNANSPGTIAFRDITFDATEGTVVNILVARTGGSVGVVSVDYATADGTAVEGSDYPATNGTLTWPAGVSSNQTISIAIIADNTAEPLESFTVTLSNVSVATLGASSSATVNISDPPPAASQSGVFKDFNVSGLAFTSGQQSGVTDSNGRFTCEINNDISFAIGGVSLGQTACATLATPNQLATDDALFDLEVTNLARFLQMLDQDGDPDNGIVISDLVQQIADNWSQVDFRTMDLAAELVQIISDAASVDGTPHALPSEGDALEHLTDTLACAYAGAYAGTFSGTNSGPAGMIIGWGGPGFGYRPLGFEWQGVDAANFFVVSGGGFGLDSITIRDLPQIDHTDPSLAGPIAGQFVTPDHITATWEGGTVDLQRIGGDNGADYRFVGVASGNDFRAYISLNFDGATFSGQAFEFEPPTTYQVTGTLTGDVVSLSATGGGSTFTGSGTLTSNPDGSPDEAQGTLNDGSSFSIVACRLN